MLIQDFADKRELRRESYATDIVVVGGGLSGVCAAISAAREGATVSLIQDRPVLGGNASSEVRVWVLGATSHMGNNNRWSREGGVIDEILLENLYRNKEGNPLFFDMVLMDKVLNEPNISLYLNTMVHGAEKSDKRNISKVLAFNPQNETEYEFSAHTYVDASGDGVLGYMAGASHRIGAERAEDHGELFAPDAEYGEVLGHSIFFYTKETAAPVEFHAPDFAIKDAEQHIPKLSNPNYFNVKQHGCKYWWLEYGGRLDTIHDTERIKHELWRVVYGVWDYIKNSGKFPETVNQTLEWVAAISGKRESRRFYGEYDLVQQDIIEQRKHYDAVAVGGWSIDLHPADAVFSTLNGCNQWHSKGTYQIPYRCYVGRDIDNLFLAGRNISATHVAHASSRVMCTAAHGGEAVGVAAALCAKSGLLPRDYIAQDKIAQVQRILIERGHFITSLEGVEIPNMLDEATLECSSTFEWRELSADLYKPLVDSVAQLVPLCGAMPKVSFRAKVSEATEVEIVLRGSTKRGNFTPDIDIETQRVALTPDQSEYEVAFDYSASESEYLFITFMKNSKVQLALSQQRISATETVYQTVNKDVSNYGYQTPPEGIGVEAFEFWCPKRWGADHNIALGFSPALQSFGVENLRNSSFRPTSSSNTWVAAVGDSEPTLTLKWDEAREIRRVMLFFDTDTDQALENNQMGHLYNRIPECVKEFSLFSGDGELLFEEHNNHLSRCCVELETPITADRLVVKLKANNDSTPASLQGVVVQ